MADKEQKKPRPEMLGTGGAAKAASAIEKHKAQQCEQIYGGMYDFAMGKCKDKKY